MSTKTKNCIRQRANGLYEIRTLVNGKRISVYGKTKSECRDKLMTKLDEISQPLSKGGFILGEWLLEWYKTYKVPRLKPLSLVSIEVCIRLHTPAWLKIIPLDFLTPTDIETALNSVASSRMRKYTYDTLHDALKRAYSLKLTSNDVFAHIEPVKHKRKNGTALLLTEQTAFLENCKQHHLGNLFKFYLYTGLRRSEALTLCWSDIDFENARIYVHGTKTDNAERTLPLFPHVRQLLEARHKDEPTIFPYKPNYVTKQFKTLCPAHRLHDLRHTFATRCLEAGVNIKILQRWLGHSKLDTTMDIYTHVQDIFEKQEASKLVF